MKCVLSYGFRIGLYSWLMCFAIPGPGSLFAQIPGVESGRRVVYAEDIERSGILRLSELLRLVDDWSITSVDDYVWQYNAGNLSDFSNQHLEILVDGQPFYLGVLTAVDLNALPVGLAVIDSVEFFSTPQLVRGSFSDRGLIHIHTKTPENGFDYQNLSWYGNETGDPGPFIFTERSSRNIDRVGPDYSNFASFRYQDFFIRAGLIDQNHYSTDGRVRQRNPGLGNSDLWLRRYLPSLQVHFPAFGGFHKLLVMHNSTEEFLGDKLNGSNPLFFEPLGREIPTERIATSAGLSGEVGADTAMVLRYRLRLSRDRVFEPTSGSVEKRLDWELDIAQASLESVLRRESYSAEVGVLWERVEPSSEFFFGADNYTTSAIFASLVLSPWQRFKYSLDGQLTTNNNQSSLKLAGGIKAGGSKRLLELQASYTERLLSENNDIWFWQDQQLRLIQANGLELFESGVAGKSRSITLNAALQRIFFKRYTIRLEGFHHSLANISIPRQQYRFVTARPIAEDIVLFHEQKGNLVGFNINVYAELNKKISLRANYRRHSVHRGSGLFEEKQLEIPNSQARLRFDWHPVESLTIQSAVNYRGATEWKQYDVQDIPFPASTKTFTTTDVSIRKLFWKKRLFGSLVMRNIFNAEQRYHPLGGQMDLNYYLRLGVNL